MILHSYSSIMDMMRYWSMPRGSVWNRRPPCSVVPHYHIIDMAPLYPSDSLSSAEFDSLLELSRGLKWRPLPQQHTAKLLRLGYAKEAIDGLSITEFGRLRIAKGTDSH